MPRFNVFATLTHVPPDADAYRLGARLLSGETATIRDVMVYGGLERLQANQRAAESRGILPAPHSGDLLDARGRVLARQATSSVKFILSTAKKRLKAGRRILSIDIIGLRRMSKGQMALNADRWHVSGDNVAAALAFAKYDRGTEGGEFLGMPFSEYDFEDWDFLIVDFEEVEKPRPRVTVGERQIRVEYKGKRVLTGSRLRKRSLTILEERKFLHRGRWRKRTIFGPWRITRVRYVYRDRYYNRLFVFFEGRLVANVPNEPGKYGGSL